MTTFDSLGLPIFEATDKIAADGDGLREDLNLITSTARNAINAAGASPDAKIGVRTIALDEAGKPYIATTDATHYLLVGADGIPYYVPTIARSVTIIAGKPTIT
jgi:hypothetical protein